MEANALIHSGVLLIAPLVAAAQLNYGFMKDTPLTKLTDSDRELMRAAVLKTVQDPDPRAKHEWSNPETNHSGVIESVDAFTTKDSRPCRKLRVENRVDAGVQNRSSMVMCNTNGTWTLDGSAKRE